MAASSDTILHRLALSATAGHLADGRPRSFGVASTLLWMALLAAAYGVVTSIGATFSMSAGTLPPISPQAGIAFVALLAAGPRLWPTSRSARSLPPRRYAIAACDQDGRLTVFNSATRRLHGLPLEPLPAERWADYYSLYHADGATPMERDEVPLNRALRGERVENPEMVVASRNAAPRRLLASGQSIVSPTGRKLGAVVAMHDITERSELEMELRHSAFHDPLTGLANRARCSSRSPSSRRPSSRSSTSRAWRPVG